MQFKNETDFNKWIKENGIKGVYLLYGSEEYLISRWRDSLVKGFVDDDFNYIKIDGETIGDFNQVYDATQQLPLMSSTKCVLINNFNLKKLPAESKDEIFSIIEELPEETVLVITAPALEPKSAQGKKLIAAVGKNGSAVEFSPRDSGGLTRHLQSVAKKNGCTLDGQLARELIRLVGNDMQTLTTETQKLCDYVGEGEITKTHIDKVVIPTVEERVFDLSKAILGSNTKRALEIVSNLMYLRESPIMIIATLVMSYVDLYRAAAAKQEGKNTNDITAVLPYKGREFRVRNAFGTKISKKALRKSLDALYSADLKMKSSQIDDGLLLEKTVVELICVRNQ